MLPVSFPGCDTTLNKPPDMTDEECMSGVPAAFCQDENGHTFYILAWKPNQQDIDSIIKGSPIYIKVNAKRSGMQPHKLFTLDDEGEPNS